MSKKTKQLNVTIPVPSEKILRHITDAYGLVCGYRTANRVPHEKMDSWLLRLIVEGCNAMYKFHDAEMKKQAEKQQDAIDAAAADAASTEETVTYDEYKAQAAAQDSEVADNE